MKVGELDEERRSLLLEMGFAPDKALTSLNGYPALHVRVGAKARLQYVHRLVAERFLGAILRRDVFVHHKDEDRWNFRLANLHVCSHAEHNGLHRQFGADNHFFGRSHSGAARKRMASLGFAGRKHSPSALAAMRAQADTRNRDSKGRLT